MSFGEKIKSARIQSGMSQSALAERVGVSLRAVTAYEREGSKPRPATLAKLAEALGVSTRYLSEDDCSDPQAELARDAYVAEARRQYGGRGAADLSELLAENCAVFAGGEVSEEQKEKFFQAITEAYFTCREEARARYGRHKQ